MTEPIRLEDRISTVLARGDQMLEVLLAASPVFSHLRNPVMRKTMAKLATVEYAARVAGLDANELLARLNAALTGEVIPTGPARQVKSPEADAKIPAAIKNASEDKIIDCDVREDLRAGKEPFRRIMDAVHSMHDGELLRLRAIFEPAPLYSVLQKQRLTHFTQRIADDDWIVWFWREQDSPSTSTPTSQESAPEQDDDVVILDVRGLEPPEPMMHTLAALEQLPRGKTLVQLNVRVPQFLIPKLAERGFVYEVREQSPDLVRIFIRHANP